MKHLKTLNAVGDTIVEVMIVLAVLGLSFSISYATANHGLAQSRNAEEHSEALGILSSQVELAREATAKGIDPSTVAPGQSFCITNPANPVGSVHRFAKVPATAAQDSANGYPNYGSCVSGLYHESITYQSGQGGYLDLRVRWDGLGSLGPQQEETSYRVYKVSVAGPAFTNNPPLPPPPCPSGTTGTYPNCVPLTCPPGTIGVYPNCVPRPCPPGTTGTYPNCVPKTCPSGTTGIYPNCGTCPWYDTGTYPDCQPYS